MSNQFCNFEDMIYSRADLFRWSQTRLTNTTILTDLRNSYQ